MDIFTVSGSYTSSSIPKHNTLKGHITTLDLSKGWGKIRSIDALPSKFRNNNSVKFGLSDVTNVSTNPVTINSGSTVHFELDEDSDPTSPDAKAVYVTDSSAAAAVPPAMSRNSTSGATGIMRSTSTEGSTVTSVYNTNKYFKLGPDSGTIQVFPSRVPHCGKRMTQGTVQNLLIDKNFGFLKTNYTKGIRFYFSKVRNVSSADVMLGPGSVVNFTLEGGSSMSDDPGSIRVALVELTYDSSCIAASAQHSSGYFENLGKNAMKMLSPSHHNQNNYTGKK